MTALNVACHDEEWRDIPGWEGVYQASSEGRIRSLDRVRMQTHRHYPDGKTIPVVRKGRVLRPGENERFYLVVVLCDQTNGRNPRSYKVHRLVCAAFRGDGGNLEAAHNNGDRQDNRIANLRWATHAENLADIAIHRQQRIDRGL